MLNFKVIQSKTMINFKVDDLKHKLTSKMNIKDKDNLQRWTSKTLFNFKDEHQRHCLTSNLNIKDKDKLQRQT